MAKNHRLFFLRDVPRNGEPAMFDIDAVLQYLFSESNHLSTFIRSKPKC